MDLTKAWVRATACLVEANRCPQVTAAEGSDAALAGELGDIGVQIHPVDALQFQHDVFLLELGEAAGYFHGEFRLGFCSPLLE
jgi:hypothetical protein